MHISQHAHQRMNQRGISRRLVEFTLRHGRVEGDRHVLDRNESRRIIEALTEELRLAKRIMDKGGVTVVEGDHDTVVTTYNVNVRMRRGARSAFSPLPWGEAADSAGEGSCANARNSAASYAQELRHV